MSPEKSSGTARPIISIQANYYLRMRTEKSRMTHKNMQNITHRILSLVLVVFAICAFSNAHAQVVIQVESDTPDPDNPGSFLNLTHRELQVAVDQAEELAKEGTNVIIELGGPVAIGRTVRIWPRGRMIGSIEIRNGSLTKAFANNIARFLSVLTNDDDAPVTINNVDFLNSRESSRFTIGFRYGGAIYANSGPLVIKNSGFFGNSTERAGGAIFADGPLTITNSQFDGNVADGEDGGAIAVTGRGPLTITSSQFSNNQSVWGGGAIIVLDRFPGSAPLTITNSLFDGNVSTGGIVSPGGGAVQSRADMTTISGSTFKNNTEGRVGGAVSINAVHSSATLLVENSLFQANHASFAGGAIYTSNQTQNGTTVQIINSTFVENTADVTGGAIYLPPDHNINPILVPDFPFGDGIPPDLIVTASTFWNNNVQGFIGGNAITARFDLPDVVQISGSIIGRSDSNIISGTNCVSSNDGQDALPGNVATGINLATDDSCGSIEFLGIAGAQTLFPFGLADNGGPALTLRPAPESTAVDGVANGTIGCPASDAVGTDRPVFNDCDFGAVESTVEPTSPPPPVDDAPLCNFLPASVYVGDDGVIVGGQLAGEAFLGTLRGTTGDDIIVGTAEADIIAALGGDDLICSMAGEDRVFSGAGDDTVFAGADDDTIFGGNGLDIITGGRGNDILWGGPGEDRITGGLGDDVLNGGEGIDLLEGENGSDTLNGGGGNDELEGGNGPDTLNGDDGDDELFGGGDRDVLNGGGGNDELYGENGRDTLDGGSGNDWLDGGDKDDVGTGGSGRDDCTRVETFSRCQQQGEL